MAASEAVDGGVLGEAVAALETLASQPGVDAAAIGGDGADQTHPALSAYRGTEALQPPAAAEVDEAVVVDLTEQTPAAAAAADFPGGGDTEAGGAGGVVGSQSAGAAVLEGVQEGLQEGQVGEEEDPGAASARLAQVQAQAQAIADRLVLEGAGGGGYEEESNNKRKFEAQQEAGGGVGSPNGFQEPLYKRSSLKPPGDNGESGFAEYEGAAAGADATLGNEYLAAMNTGYEATGAPEAYAQPAAFGEAAGSVSDYVDCPRGLVGKLIGRQGATIQSLQTSTGAKIQIDHNTPGDVKRVSVMGTADAVHNAKEAIKGVLESDSPSSVPGDVTQTVDCPQGIVGRVIGRGGETIKLLQQNSGAHIVVDQNFPDGVPRKVNINGRPDAVERAVNMVTELITGEPGSAQSVVQKYGLGISRTVQCPKVMVGRVIGKGGETIKSLQRQTMASIQIDQQSDPMIITITGSKQAVQTAEMTIRQIVAGEPYPGGGMGAGGFPGGGRGGGLGAYGASVGPYGGGAGYGAPMGAPGGYGAYGGGYAAPQANPAYGGYYGAPYGGGAYASTPASQAGGYGGGYGGGAGGYGAQADPYANTGAYSQGGYGAGQQAAAPAAAASVWQELHDDQGRPYYYNTQTGVSQWEKPQDM